MFWVYSTQSPKMYVSIPLIGLDLIGGMRPPKPIIIIYRKVDLSGYQIIPDTSSHFLKSSCHYYNMWGAWTSFFTFSLPLLLQAYLIYSSSVAAGAQSGIEECKYQFAWDRWNCPERALQLSTHSSLRSGKSSWRHHAPLIDLDEKYPWKKVWKVFGNCELLFRFKTLYHSSQGRGSFLFVKLKCLLSQKIHHTLGSLQWPWSLGPKQTH